jgi:NAD+ diphosphatase
MDILRHFVFCPRCAQRLVQPPPAPNYIECTSCRFRCYFNAGAAAACFVRRSDGTVLFIRRAKDPAQGRLAPPGGFVDAGESAEQAVTREIFEEVGFQISPPQFLGSFPNSYFFREIHYTTLDLFFTATLESTPGVTNPEEVQSLVWLNPMEVDPDEMAFPSMKAALILLKNRAAEPR